MNAKERRLYEILLKTARLPKNLITHQDRNNIAEFIIHSLAAPDCFNLNKAAYFIDNPDFDHFRGVVGHNIEEAYQMDHWEKPDLFSNHMKEKVFNQVVRSITLPSVQRNAKDPKAVCNELSYSLGIENARHISVPVKHGNLGYLLFEPTYSKDTHELLDEHLELLSNLLAFCPIF